MRVRRDKRERLVASGHAAYPVSVDRSHTLAEIRQAWAHLQPGEQTEAVVRTAGRVVFLRNTGKLCFATLQEGNGTRLQVMVSQAEIGQAALADWKALVDLGDHVAVEGRVISSKRGELSVLAGSWQMASKALRPLPTLHKELSEETRVRQRYADLIVRQEARDMVRLRATATRTIREVMHRHEFVEVETPVLQLVHGGAAARPFRTHLNAFDQQMTLRILDCRHLGKDFFDKRFPSIAASLRDNGFEPSTDLLPVAPAQHYASGGVRTDLDGRCSLDGLYACGEVSCTGVHGANRLASNSLLEGLVFAHRIADDIAERFARGELPARTPLPAGTHVGGADTVLLRSAHRKAIQRAMTAGSGVVRTEASLAATADALAQLAVHADGVEGGPKSWQTTNLLHLGQVLTDAAYRRTETRGGHVRADHPDRDDERWLGHLHSVRRPDGTIEVTYHQITAAADPDPVRRAGPAQPT